MPHDPKEMLQRQIFFRNLRRTPRLLDGIRQQPEGVRSCIRTKLEVQRRDHSVLLGAEEFVKGGRLLSDIMADQGAKHYA